MKGITILGVFTSVIVQLHTSPVRRTTYCDPCRGRLTHDVVNTATDDFGISKDVLANEIQRLYTSLSSAIDVETRPLVQSDDFNTMIDSTDVCPAPRRRARKWLMCVYDKISEALQNVTEADFSSPLEISRILKAGNKLFCHLKLTLVQTESNPGRFIAQLSNKPCELSARDPVVTPRPEQVLSSLRTLVNARNVVFKVNETLVKEVPGRLFEFGYNRDRRRKNSKRKQRRKCRKLKRKFGKNKRCKLNKRNKSRNNRRNKRKNRNCLHKIFDMNKNRQV